MSRTTVGVVSDTHNLLRPEAIDALAGCDLILHAGDVGAPEILSRLGQIAPVRAVRGNIDVEPWAAELPLVEVIEVHGLHLYMLHDLHALDLDPRAAGFAAVIFGHSHLPSSEVRGGVLYFNPGSPGPRRFRLPVSLGRLQIKDDRITPELITLG